VRADATIGVMPAVNLAMDRLIEGLPVIAASPKDRGVLELIVRRPAVGERVSMREGVLDLNEGLVGDSWKMRASSRTADGSPHPDMQINVMNSRVIALLAQDDGRWELAGDQLFVDLDLSAANLPPGTRLSLGSAVIEITAQPHTGCHKFLSRFGEDAVKFVNSKAGSDMRLRGLNAKVVRAGTIRVGDTVSKLAVTAGVAADSGGGEQA